MSIARADVRVIAIVGLLVAAALGTAILGPRLEDGTRDPAGIPPAAVPVIEPGRAAPLEGSTDGLLTHGPVEVGPPGAYRYEERSYDGTCTISGAVEVVGDLPFPTRWRLVIEPSLVGVAREHALRRERDFDGSFRTFEESGLPMGGYRVYVEAAGLYCAPQEVFAYRFPAHPNLRGKDHIRLTLQLVRAGFMDGAVRDESGAPVEGLGVTLERRRTGLRRRTTTGADGLWRFDDLPDASYRLYLGDPNQPLLPAEDISYVGPQHRHPDQVIPVTASVRFVALDDLLLPIPGASVHGFGKPAGTIDVTTGEDGMALARFLPAGEYWVRVNHSSGVAGRIEFALAGDEVERRIEVHCRRDE